MTTDVGWVGGKKTVPPRFVQFQAVATAAGVILFALDRDGLIWVKYPEADGVPTWRWVDEDGATARHPRHV